MWKCKATRHQTSMVVCYSADIGTTSSRVTHSILDQHENAGEVSPTDIGPISGRCGNARWLDIRPVWLFDMQPTSVIHRLHIRYQTDMRMPAKCRLLISDRGKSRCRADVVMHGGSTSGRYGCLICSRQRSYIEPCCTSDIGPTWEQMSARCRKVHRPDIGPMGPAYGANVLLYHTIAAMAKVTVHMSRVVIFSIWSFASIPRLPSWQARS